MARGDNKCASCGEFAGKGHRCATPLAVYPGDRPDPDVLAQITAADPEGVAARVEFAREVIARKAVEPAATWVVIDDKYRDQMLDPLPGSPAHWAEIGPSDTFEGTWSVTIRAFDPVGEEPYDEDGDIFPNELSAKVWAERWQPGLDPAAMRTPTPHVQNPDIHPTDRDESNVTAGLWHLRDTDDLSNKNREVINRLMRGEPVSEQDVVAAAVEYRTGMLELAKENERRMHFGNPEYTEDEQIELIGHLGSTQSLTRYMSDDALMLASRHINGWTSETARNALNSSSVQRDNMLFDHAELPFESARHYYDMPDTFGDTYDPD